MRRKTQEQYQEQLLNTEYIAVGSYQTAHKHILHRHSTCGHQWFIKPNSILQGSECPNCYKISQTKTHKQYVEELNHDYQVLEPYVNDRTKILHKHVVCGYEWLVRPNDIISRPGCPKCANKNSRFVYYIYFPELDLYKIGITNNINVRITSFGYKAVLLFAQEYQSGSKAYDIEQELLNQLKPLLINTGLLKSGNTETFRWPQVQRK